jgi:hypothetical protein
MQIVELKRECGECTRCCEGWLTGEIYGHKFYPSQPCFFLGKNCTIYEDRPDTPCKAFKCEWLQNNNFPEWLKPNISNVIVLQKVKDNILYYEAVETGKKIDSVVLNWIIQQILQRGLNLYYKIESAAYKIGSEEFLKLNLSNSTTK